jgi:hypothetical protein
MPWEATATASDIAPEGLYVMKTTEIGDPQESEGMYGKQVQVRLILEIQKVIHSNDEDAEDYVGEDVYAWANFAWSPNAKLRAWSEAILDTELEEDETVSSDELLDRLVLVTIGKSKTGKLKVTDMQPYKAPARKPKKAKAEPVETEDDEDESPAPAPARKRKAKAPVAVADEDEDDEDEDDGVPF